MALGKRTQRQLLTLAITTDLLELFHSGSHFLPAPDPRSMSTGASADHRTRWGQFKPSQWGQIRPSFLVVGIVDQQPGADAIALRDQRLQDARQDSLVFLATLALVCHKLREDVNLGLEALKNPSPILLND